MVVTEGHWRKMNKRKTRRERPARLCQGASICPKEHNTEVCALGRTLELLKGRVRGYPVTKIPQDENLGFVQDPN